MGKKLFFCLQGVDLNDDDAIDAVAQLLWEEATPGLQEQQTENGLNQDPPQGE